MGRSPCCAKVGLKRGAWDATEDEILTDFIKTHGEGKWKSLPQRAGLKRCGKSCRLRWLNYLKPGIKRGNISPEEDDLIFRLHKILGNRWSLIAGRLPGRTDNEIKNYWNSNLAKRIGAQSFSEPSKSSSAKKDHAENPAPEATGVPATIPIRTKARKLSKKLPDMMPLNDFIIKSSQPQNAVQPDIVQPHEENDCNQGEDIQPDIVQPHEENDYNQGEDIQPYIVQSNEENDCNQGEGINVVHSDLDLHTMKFASDELQAHNNGAKEDFIFTNDLCLSQECSLDVHGETTLDWLFKQMSEDDKMNIDLGSLDSFLGYDEWLNY